MVARSMLQAQPSPFKPPVKLGNGAELTWDEEGQEARWLIDDQAVFYRTSFKIQPSAEHQGKRNFHDLNIVMPIVLPSSEIRVHNIDGENYYNLSHSDLGAHLLFGKDSLSTATLANEKIKPGSPPTADTEPEGKGTKKICGDEENEGEDISKKNKHGPMVQPEEVHAEIRLGHEEELQTDHKDFVVAAPLYVDENSPPAVCDVWASFLHIQLGVLRNCRSEQIPEIVRLFHKAFSEDNWATFPTPIEVDCKGIYPAVATESNAKGGDTEGPSFERYETRGVFVRDIDRRRFRIIRRRLKKFLLMLWDQFGVEAGGPKFDAALNLNCRTGDNDFVRVEIRRYSPLLHSGLLKHIWSEQSASARAVDSAPPEAIIATRLSEGADPVIPRAKIAASEVRLEMTHARMIDPRWTKQWVLARRMPAMPPTSASARPLLARHVFAPKGITKLPTVVYEFNNPKNALLQSRFSPLYLLADVVCRDAEAATIETAACTHKAIIDDPAVIAINKHGSKQASVIPNPAAPTLASAVAAHGTHPQAQIGATAQESTNNSNLKATAVPFYPLAAVLNSITQPTGATAWDKLISMANVHPENSSGMRGAGGYPGGIVDAVPAAAFPLNPTLSDFDGTKEVDGQAILNAIFNYPPNAAPRGPTGPGNIVPPQAGKH